MNDKVFAILEKIESSSERQEIRFDKLEKRLDSFEKKFATKDDISDLKKELIEYTDGWFGDLLEAVDKNKAEVNELENLKMRERNIERKLLLQ